MRRLLHISSAWFCLPLLGMMLFASCQESLEERAEREAREYTEKNCPTPPENGVITDSLVFNKSNKTQFYYLTFTGEIDEPEMIAGHEDELRQQLLEQIRYNPTLRPYKEAGFSFAYVCRSQKTGKTVLNYKFTPKDYK